jgi:ParB-like chromosome segregation protein Spo0J
MPASATRLAAEQLESHPDAKLFPLMGAEDLRLLTEDIAANGLLEDIELVDGMVIDGRNRLRACQRLNLTPRCAEVELNGRRPIEHVLSKNLRRRNLTTVQLALLALDLLPYYVDDALERKHRGRAGLLPEQEPERGKTAERIAGIVGIAADTVRRMIAIQKADPQVVELMRHGMFTSVRAAAAAAGLSVSFHQAPREPDPPSFHQQQRDRWDIVIPPLASYLAKWLRQPLSLSPKEARKRLRDLRRVQAGLDELAEKLEARALMRD